MQEINLFLEIMQKLEDREFYSEKFLGILPKIVEELCAFAGKYCDIVGGLVDAIIKRFVI